MEYAFHEVAEQRYAKAVATFGAIYALRDDQSGHIKIGHSTDVLRRISQLQTGNSRRLRLVTIIAGQQSHERALHRVFSDRRIVGEWFDDQDKEVSETLRELGQRAGEGVTWDMRKKRDGN